MSVSPMRTAAARLPQDRIPHGWSTAARSADTAPRSAEPQPDARLMMQALDALSEGLILTDLLSNVLYANHAARTLLASGPLRIRNGILCAATTSDTRELQSAIATDRRERPGSTSLRATTVDGRQSLFVTVTTPDRWTQDPLSDEQTVVVSIREPALVEPPSPQILGAFFALTPAEARIAHEMTRGEGLKACARRLSITPNTARTHLNRVFEKTSTRRQAELVRLLLTCCTVGRREARAQVL